ncbi:TPA_asm: G [Nitraria betacytorhabdovirus 1]|nr:TPA_asm: G [Nitraria betacytorhabdovirus 1]
MGLLRMMVFIAILLTAFNYHVDGTDNKPASKINSISKTSLKPLMSCDGPTKGVDKVTRECLTQCPDIDRPYSVEKWRIYDKVQPTGTIEVFHCAVIKEVWKYEESWLLSRSEGELIESSRLPVNASYCVNLMRSKCGGLPCNIVPQHNYSPEYHYASTTYKTYVYGTGKVMKMTSYVVDGNKIYLHGLRSSDDEVEVSLGNVTSSDRLDAYTWNKNEFHTECHLKTYISVQCLRSANHLMCNDVGVYAVLEGSINLLNCKVDPGDSKGQRLFYRSDLGLWLEEEHSEAKLTNRQYLNFPPRPVSLNEKDLINGINEIMRVKDEKDCVSSCLTLKKSGLETGKVDVVGYNFAVEKNNSLTMCRPLYNCAIEKKSRVCSNPIMVRISCGAEVFWWDPMSLYVEPNTLCLGSLKNINHLTMLTNIGLIYINGSGVFSVNDGYKNPEIIHPLPKANQISEEIISSFVDLIDTSDSLNSDDSDVHTHVETDGRLFTELGISLEAIKDWMSSIPHLLRLVMFSIIFISLALLLTYMIKICNQVLRKRHMGNPEYNKVVFTKKRDSTKMKHLRNSGDKMIEGPESDIVFI